MTKEIHVDEAGIHAGSPIIVISVLVVENAEATGVAIKAAKDRHHFGDEMKSSKWSHLRERVYRDVLSEVAQQDISALVLVASKKEASSSLRLPVRVLGDYFTEVAIRHMSPALVGGNVYLDEKSGKPRAILLARLMTDLGGKGLVREIDSRGDDLMQIADLLCGTIYGLETGNRRKQQLFELIAHKVTVWHWKP